MTAPLSEPQKPILAHRAPEPLAEIRICAQRPAARVLLDLLRLLHVHDDAFPVIAEAIGARIGMSPHTVREARRFLLDNRFIFPAGVAAASGPGRPAALYTFNGEHNG